MQQQTESLADIAARVAERWPVFPVRIDEHGEKRPLVKWRDGAVRGAAAARALFEQWAGVANAYGVAVGWGAGVFVLDIDVRSGGKEWFLANEHRLGVGLAHRTRSGGIHLFFRMPAGFEVRNSASKLAAGVDVRGEGGYVVGPGSPGYSVAREGEIPECPEWLLAELQALKPKPVDLAVLAGTSAADVLSAAGLMGDGTAYGLAALKRAVAAIVGAEDGTKHDTLNREAYGVGGLVSGGEVKDEVAWAALEAALGEIAGACRDLRAAQETLRDGYAEGKAKPRPEGVRRLQQAVGDFAGVEAPVLGHNGGPPLDDDGSGDTLQERMFQRYVWVESVERIGDTETKALLSRVQFNARLAEIGPPHDSRNCAWAQFLTAKHGQVQCKRVADVTYRPGGAVLVAEEGKGLCFNTWAPSSLVPAAGVTDDAVRLFLELAERVYADPEVRKHVLDFYAALVQRPGVKPAFVLVMGGHEGIGKDSLVAPVVAALGQHNVQNITMAAVMGPNTHWVANCQLVIITEMHSFARREVMERLKPIGAAPPNVLEVNRKYMPQYTVPNIIAGIYFTNHLDALALSDSDRRHLVAWSHHENPEAMDPARKKAFEEWFTGTYWPWLKNGGYEAVAGWLKQRDITEHLKLARAPWTQEKGVMRREGRSEAVAEVEDALEAMDLPDLVNPEDLATRLNAAQRWGKAATARSVARALRAMGAKPVTDDAVAVPPSATVSSAKRVRVWAMRNYEAYDGVRPVALSRMFAEMWGTTKQDLEAFFTPKSSPLPHMQSPLRGQSGES
jgi:hypothetical protein